MSSSVKTTSELNASKYKINQFTLKEQIGQGSFGIVKLVFDEHQNNAYAMKIISKKRLKKKSGFRRPDRKKCPSLIDNIYREIAILKKLCHQNIVQLVEVIDNESDDNLYMVYELMLGGEVLDLDEEGNAKAFLPEHLARKYFLDVLMALEYMHANYIVHKDIKPSNILLDKANKLAKLADLGVSEEFDPKSSKISKTTGTPAFSSPELIKGEEILDWPAIDIWSLGITLFAFVFGKIPFKSASYVDLYDKIINEELEIPEEPKVSEECTALIEKMLIKSAVDRNKIENIRTSKWFQNNFDTESYKSYHKIDEKSSSESLLPIKLISVHENTKTVEVTNDDVDNAVRKFSDISSIVRVIGIVKRMSKKRNSLKKSQGF